MIGSNESVVTSRGIGEASRGDQETYGFTNFNNRVTDNNIDANFGDGEGSGNSPPRRKVEIIAFRMTTMVVMYPPISDMELEEMVATMVAMMTLQMMKMTTMIMTT